MEHNFSFFNSPRALSVGNKPPKNRGHRSWYTATNRRRSEEMEAWIWTENEELRARPYKVKTGHFKQSSTYFRAKDLKKLKLDISSNQQHIFAPSVTLKLLNCLPDEVHHLFGRSEDIIRAIEAVQSGTVSIVSLTGGPGFRRTTLANKVAHEPAKPKYNRSVLYCSLLSQASLGDIATTMFLICSNSHSQPPENPTLWLRNWSIQRVEKVTLILDNADHVLESGDRQEFVNMLRDLRIYSRQSLSFIITGIPVVAQS